MGAIFAPTEWRSYKKGPNVAAFGRRRLRAKVLILSHVLSYGVDAVHDAKDC
jgi:hypothetical protein